MEDCWATNPNDHPTVSELCVGLACWNPDISALVSNTVSPSTNQLITQKVYEGSAVLESNNLATNDEDPPVISNQ